MWIPRGTFEPNVSLHRIVRSACIGAWGVRMENVLRRMYFSRVARLSVAYFNCLHAPSKKKICECNITSIIYESESEK